jgi:hypothetical protein
MMIPPPREESMKNLEFVELEVRPRSEPRSYRDVSISAIHRSFSDKEFQMSRHLKSQGE